MIAKSDESSLGAFHNIGTFSDMCIEISWGKISFPIDVHSEAGRREEGRSLLRMLPRHKCFNVSIHPDKSV